MKSGARSGIGRKPSIRAGGPGDDEGGVAPDGEKAPVGEVDDAEDGEDQRVAEGEDGVHAADREAVQHLLEQERPVHYLTKTNVPLVPSGSILICATYDCFWTISPPMPGPVVNEISPSGVS